MALTADNVGVAATGAVMMSTVGASAPTDATAAWSTAWSDLGYLSEDGFTENSAIDSEEIKAWQSGAVVRRVITGSRMEFAFTAIEGRTRKVLEAFYPGSTVTTSSVAVKLPVATPVALGFDVVDGNNRVRFVVPNAELVERGEVQFVNGAAYAFPFRFNVKPDATGQWATRYVNPALS